MLAITFEAAAAAARATAAPASKALAKKPENVAEGSKSCKPPVSRRADYEGDDCLQEAQKDFLSPL